uniref:Ankyrin repeat and fibronectin type-III domain-containing protein 1 n=1 Tax=Cacopsylla melanoneura TaxID=428564 RepID=A0A8D8YBP6_9HEMI
MNPEEKKESNQGLSIDRAALILLRVKRVFRKKKQQRNKEKQGGDPVHILNKSSSIKKKVPPPLLRSRTLPAIVVPGLSILQAQISDNRSTSTLDTTCDNNSNMLQSDLPGIIYDSNCLDPRRHLVHHRLSSPEASAGMADAMLQLKISAPPRALSASGPACSSQTALYSRLARLLNQNQKSPVEAFHNATRRLSWERDEDSDELLNFPRSASIDSIVESRHCGVQLVRKLPSPLLNRGGSTTPPLSPAIARRLKGTRAITSLFAAVEHGHVDKTRTILESADVNVNSMNSDGFTPLDVAILSNNASLVKLLISFGAQEGNKFTSPDKLGAHLRHLLHEAERRVLDLGGETSNSHHHSTLSINRGSISVADSERSDKTLALWERRCKGLKKMLLGFDQARPPDTPSSVSVEVTGVSSVCVSYQEPDSSSSPQCTKYKVEWSLDPEFQQVSGSCVILDSKQHSLEVSGLAHGQRVYFRAFTGNIRGFSPAKVSVPAFVEPSSWRDCSCVKTERISSDGLALLDRLFSEMKNERPDLKTYNEPVEDGGGDCAGKRKKTASIKQLFTAASKFQKHLKRGVFLSCLLYHEDKVLVTNEDFLPVIEIDDTYPNSIYQDFHWLLKVSCTWEDIKLLRNEMEKSLSNSNTSNHFRVKLLNASLQMQTALSIENIGQLYHRPIKDSEGTIVIPLINYVKNVKSISVLNSRWLPLSKLTKTKRTNMCTENNVSEMLMASVQDQITYHQVSRIKLSKGLYLGYLKMRSSVDLLQVLVPSKSPNVPPHCKIRENPHVTADEWEVLRSCNSSDKLSGLSEQQRMFLEHVALTMKRLFRYMEVTEDDCALHRLYDSEVIEISPEVSLIMIVPPIESACSVPGQRELLLQRPDLLPLPVQVFEMVHLGTYQRSLVSKYSRLSCILQLDTALAQQGHREAFSNTEVSLAKERLSRLETLQSRLNTTWKQTRWLLDVLSYARDRMATQCSSVPSVKYLLSLCNASAEANTGSSCDQQLLN